MQIQNGVRDLSGQNKHCDLILACRYNSFKIFCMGTYVGVYFIIGNRTERTLPTRGGVLWIFWTVLENLKIKEM